MNRTKTFLKTMFLSSLAILSGCVSYSQQFHDPKTGQVASCSSEGFGIIGSTVAAVRFHNCSERAQSKGYTK